MSTVQITRRLSAPPERVWSAFTQPEVLVAWFWPASFATQVTAEVRPGGDYRIEARTPAMAVSGRYLEVTPPKRLVFTWRWDGEEGESLVTIELSALDGGTELHLHHEQLAGTEARDLHAQGWNDCLDRLTSSFGRYPS